MIRIFEDDILVIDYDEETNKYVFSFFYEGHFIDNYFVSGDIKSIN